MINNYFFTIRQLNRNIHMYLIATALLGFTVDGGIYSVLFNLYLVRLGHDAEFIGTVNSAGLITFALLSLPAGMLGGRWGSRPVMITGLTLMLLGCSLLPLAEFVPTDWQAGGLIGTYILTFLGLALYFVNAAPFAMSATEPEKRSHVFSVQVALWSLAGFAGSLVGGILPRFFATLLNVSLDDPAPYRYPLFIAAVLIIPGILAIVTARPQENVLSGSPSERPTGLNLTQAAWASLGLIALMALIRMLQVTSMGATTTFFNVYLDTVLQVSTLQIGLLSAVGRLLAVPAAMVTPILTARKGHSAVVIWASLGGTLSMLPLALIPHWGAAGLGFMGVVALSSVRYSAFLVYSMELISPELRGTMSGAGEMAGGFSFSLMALTGGYLVGLFGYTSLFLIGASLSALGTLLFWIYVRRPQRQLAYQQPGKL
jgi:MFS family permease